MQKARRRKEIERKRERKGGKTQWHVKRNETMSSDVGKTRGDVFGEEITNRGQGDGIVEDKQ